MNKFHQALEQAQRDRQESRRASETNVTPVKTSPRPLRVTPMATAPAPTEIPTGVDEHFVSLLTPGAFEAEQYRALRH